MQRQGGGAQMMHHCNHRAAAAAQLLLFHSHTGSPSDHQYRRHLRTIAAPGGGTAAGASISNVMMQAQPQEQLQLALGCAPAAAAGGVAALEHTVADNPVVVFSISSCCLCHVVKKLFCGMGVSPAVVEIDELEGVRAAEIERVLAALMGARPAVPAVFVGGKLVGGLDRLMACHISGALIPELKAAGALWL